MSNYLYIQEEFTEYEQSVTNFIDSLKAYAETTKTHVYIIKKPLIDQKEDYPYTDAFVVLFQDHKILFVNFGTEEEKEEFYDYVIDFLEDLGSISRDFSYQKVIDRPRKWKDELVKEINISKDLDIKNLIKDIELSDEYKRKANLIISLLIGSINDIERVKSDKLAANPLERIKQKIVLFDTDQTKFIYKPIKKDKIIIQGLSGTGKTELL
jgi:superfamily I DNA and RNA helicase